MLEKLLESTVTIFTIVFLCTVLILYSIDKFYTIKQNNTKTVRVLIHSFRMYIDSFFNNGLKVAIFLFTIALTIIISAFILIR